MRSSLLDRTKLVASGSFAGYGVPRHGAAVALALMGWGNGNIFDDGGGAAMSGEVVHDEEFLGALKGGDEDLVVRIGFKFFQLRAGLFGSEGYAGAQACLLVEMEEAGVSEAEAERLVSGMVGS